MKALFLRIAAFTLISGFAAAQTASPPAGPSFEAFRLRSGMTAEEVSKEFPTYELRWLRQPRGAAMLVNRPVNPDNPDIYASLAFCQNRLVSVIRDVDPDTEFLAYVQDYIRDFGQPQVTIRKEPWTGLRGGDLTEMQLTWIRNQIRRVVSLVPEGRTGQGELRYIRMAAVGVNFDPPCK